MKNSLLDQDFSEYKYSVFSSSKRLNHGAGLGRSKGGKFRQEVYYDENVEECFTFRDSQNNKVDDIIEILSSDDELVITTIKKGRKQKKMSKIYPKVLDRVCRKQLKDILDEESFALFSQILHNFNH